MAAKKPASAAPAPASAPKKAPAATGGQSSTPKASTPRTAAQPQTKKATPAAVKRTPTPKAATTTTRTTPRTKRPPVRPSTQTPERMSRILQNLAIGNAVKTSALAAGVPYPTFARWLQEGAAILEDARGLSGIDEIEVAIAEWLDDRPGLATYNPAERIWRDKHPEWWPTSLAGKWHRALLPILVQHARYRAEAAYVQIIRNAATVDFRAAAWWLERSSPNFMKRDRVEVTGADGGPVEINVDINSIAEKITARLSARAEIEA